MKTLKRIGAGLGIIAASGLLLLLVSAAVHYRPSAVMGKRVDTGAIQSLDGGSARLSDYASRVVLISFAANH